MEVLGGCFTEVPGVVSHSVTFPRVGKASHPEFKSSKNLQPLLFVCVRQAFGANLKVKLCEALLASFSISRLWLINDLFVISFLCPGR